MIKIDIEAFYRLDELANLLEISVETLRKEIRNKKLKAKKKGRSYIVEGLEARNYLKSE